MSNVRAKIEGLVGQKLETLSRQKGFTVTEVKGGYVYFVPDFGIGKRRCEPLSVFEFIATLEWAQTDLTSSRIKMECPALSNAPYIAAILSKVMEP